jgi:hypothetical protein
MHVRMLFKMEFDLTNDEDNVEEEPGWGNKFIWQYIVCRHLWIYYNERGSCPVSLNNTE